MLSKAGDVMKIPLPSDSVASSCYFLAWFLTHSGILEALAKAAENKGSVSDKFADITEAVLAKKVKNGTFLFIIENFSKYTLVMKSFYCKVNKPFPGLLKRVAAKSRMIFHATSDVQL